MFLTYASIVSTYVPIIVKAASEQSKKQPSAEAASSGAPATAAQAKPAPTLMGLVVALALLAAFVLAVPFLGGFENIMGIIIIAIGLYEAWKINRRAPLVITGPYRVAPAPRAPAAG
jgi:hypothetical protein